MVQDKNERTNVHQSMVNYYNDQYYWTQQGGVARQLDTFNDRAPHYSNHAQQLSHDATQRELKAQDKVLIVQQKKSRYFNPYRKYYQFYLSLRRSEEAQRLLHTYAIENLRFNRPKAGY